MQKRPPNPTTTTPAVLAKLLLAPGHAHLGVRGGRKETGPGGARASAFQRLGRGFPERSDSLSGSEACEGAYGALLTLGASLEGSQVEAAEREVQRLQAQEEATLGKGMLQVAMPRYLAPARPPC